MEHYEVIKEDKVGNHMKFTIGKGEQQILIIGHFDTVWEKGRLKLKKKETSCLALESWI